MSAVICSYNYYEIFVIMINPLIIHTYGVDSLDLLSFNCTNEKYIVDLKVG